jgi:hypothetical protein
MVAEEKEAQGVACPVSVVDIEGRAAFYLGRTEEGAPYMLPHKNLSTHGVVIGMTGSGKTGLSVALLEEAALDGIPSIVIDPKGDLGNLLLTFPALDAASFAPFVPEGEDPEAVAARWREGLTNSRQDAARVARLKNAADFAIYTPGSRTGIPVSIVGSLSAPPADLLDDAELFRERVTTVVTSLLGLLGVEADPVKSREHILLSTLLAQAWQKGKDLDLPSLVMRIREPGIKKVGVLDLESFFPEKERFELAVLFNNLIAAPGFETWLEGAPLDVGSFFRTPSGKPRVAIFSIAHLGDAERMFFVSVLLAQVVAWMRTQSGTTSLRALLFMDEIVGYFPPVRNPPSKAPLMLLLKQARAFGLGVVLATQNPVDIDYKGLANCGTWFIGRLQTERDKARVLEGLEGTQPGKGFDKGAVERTLAGLPPRTFVVHDVREEGPFLMESRFTLSYLKGPLRRDEVKRLMAEHDAREAALARASEAEDDDGPKDAHGSASTDRPAVPEEIRELFFPLVGAPGQVPTYQPVLVARATVRFSDAKTKLEYARDVSFYTPLVEGALVADWSKGKWTGLPADELGHEPMQDARFLPLPKEAGKTKSYATWQKGLVAWLVDTQGVARPYAAKWKLYGEPGENEASFRGKLELRLREEREAALEALNAKYRVKFEALREKIAKAHAALVQKESDVRTENVGSAFAVGAEVMALFGARSPGRKILGSAAQLSKQAGRVQKAKGSVEERRAALAELQAKGQTLDAEYRAEAAKVVAELAGPEVEQVLVRAKKTGIDVKLMTLAWKPVG